MKILHPLKNIEVSKVFYVSIFLLFYTINSIFADTGNIFGRVIDSESGDPLRSATIMVKETKKGAFSDVKGEFKIKNLKPGKYSLKVSYIGYIAKEIENIEVPTAKDVNLNIVMFPEAKMLEEVVVDAARVTDNEAAILAIRKNASQISDGISIEEIKRLPDSDAGQSLKRVAGVTLVDNKFIYVRGVSERYNNTTLNGTSVTTTEPDKKSFSYDIFPADFLQNISIVKSFTPDLPGNFAGGLVQLNTMDFPDKFYFSASVTSNINTNLTGKANSFVYSNSGSKDWLGVDDGTRALPSDFPATRREVDLLRTSAYNPYDTTNAKQKYSSLAKSFNSQNWKRERKTISPFDNRKFSLSYSDVIDIAEDSKFGLISSLYYGNSYSLNMIERNRLTFDGDKYFFNSTGIQSTKSINLGGLLNLAYKLGSNNLFSIKNIFNRTAEDEVTELSGQDSAYQFLDFKNFSTQYVQKEIFSTQISGEHTLSFNNILFDWRGGYSKSTRYEPDYRRLKFARQLADVAENPNTPFSPQFIYTEYGDGARIGRFYSNLNDISYSGGANISIPLGLSKLKFGMLYENNERKFNARSLTVITPPEGLAEDIDSILYDYNHPERIFAPENFRVEDGFRISEDSKLMDSYNASENMFAAYVMLDLPFEAFNEKFRFIGGLRFEGNRQILSSFTNNDEPLDVNRETDDLLPSLNLVWRMTETTNIRFSASQTLTRPTLREYAPFAFYDFLTQMLVQGNPNLVRSLIQNYDLRYELFPNAGEVLSFSIFYKTFNNAIEETIFPQQSEITRTFDNAQGDARNYGLEVEFRKNLGFISNIFNTLHLNVNFALINTEVTVLQGGKGTEDTRQMWGQSPYTLNIGLFYVEPNINTSFNLGYNIYGKRIIQVAQQGIYTFDNPHVFELPRHIVDLSIIQPLFAKMEFKLSIKNLLNQKLTFEQGGKRTELNNLGTNISVGFNYKFH